MIADLRPYPAMRDSGMPWLGGIPEHWKAERAKWLFRKMNRPVRGADEVVTCFRDGTVTLRKNRRVRGFTESLKEIGYQGIRRGDLVIHAMDAFAGAIGVSDSDGKGTPVYAVCEPASMANAHYYAYTVREMARNQWIQALAKGIRERSTDFRFDGFGSQLLPLPALPEQAAIVRFLDHADRRIRRYIRAKHKLIKLLEEQKQAIIHRAVTRGLDPYVRLKPSGVDWLGGIPEAWNIARLGQLLRGIDQGWSPVPSEERDIPSQWSVLTLSSVRRGTFDARATKPVPVTDRALQNLEIREGDLLLTRANTRELVGDTCLVEGVERRTIISDLIFRLKVNEEMALPLFLMYQLLSPVGRRQIETDARGASGTMPKIRQQGIRRWVFALPPVEEQVQICAFLVDRLAQVSKAKDLMVEEIRLVREVQKKLVADVVTGKLDVREAAARLPDEAEEPELLDEPDALGDAEEATADDLDPELEETEA